MLRPSLFWKFFGASLALIVLTAAIAGWIATNRVASDAAKEVRTTLEKQVLLLEALLAPSFPDEPSEAFQEGVHDLGARLGTRITVVRADGVVLGDSSEDPAVMNNHGDRPEILASRDHEYGYAVRHSATLGTDMVYVARTLREGTEIVGYVRGALPAAHLTDRLTAVRSTILKAVGFALVVGLLAALVIARRLARPLRSMTRVASAIAGGDYEQRVDIRTRDEVGELGGAFNEMASRLAKEVATIREDRRELQAILEGMAEGVLALDADERVAVMNDAAGRILGVAPAHATGRPVRDLLRHPELPHAMVEAIRMASPRSSEIELMTEGRGRTVRLHASPLLTEEGERRGVILVLEEVSEGRRLDAIRRDFFANASHELKTPLAAIQGLLETVLDDPEMDADTRRGFLERVLRQTSRLADLVSEMLALARLEARSLEGKMTVVDIRGPVAEVVDDASPVADECGVRVSMSLPEVPAQVRGQEEGVRRIAGNLLDNAIQHSGRDAQVEVQVRVEDESVVLEVRDEGGGIAADQQERIFERFYRIDSGRARHAGGTGLGLAIVKHLVQALHGRIEVESQPGRGSVFRVRLPRA
ncbi:MAG: sensor histidine kinase [Planctomycetota bacterium]